MTSDPIALIAPGVAWTCADLDAHVSSAATTLCAMGLSKGEHVALRGDMSADTVVAILALIRIGAVACPLSPRLPEAALREAMATAACTRLLDVPIPGETADAMTPPPKLSPEQLARRERVEPIEISREVDEE